MERILVIDGSNVLYRYALLENLRLYSSQLVDIAPVYYSLKMIYSLIDRYRPDKVYITFDIGRSIKKLERFEKYKETRSISSSISGQSLSQVAYERLKISRLLLIEILSTTPIKVVSVPLVEGDTLLAFLVKEELRSGNRVILFSNDKDFYQLLSDSLIISLKDSKTKLIREITSEQANEVYESLLKRPVRLKELASNLSTPLISFSSIPYYRAFLGDTSDAIPGIKNIGPGIVSYLIHLQQYFLLESFDGTESFFSFLKKVSEVPEEVLREPFRLVGLQPPKVKVQTRLKEFLENKEEKEIFKTNFEIMDFEEAIRHEISPQVKVTLYDEIRKEVKYNESRFFEFIREYDFNSEPDYLFWHLVNKALESKDYSILTEKSYKVEDFTRFVEAQIDRVLKASYREEVIDGN